jgi:hypothetical protein
MDVVAGAKPGLRNTRWLPLGLRASFSYKAVRMADVWCLLRWGLKAGAVQRGDALEQSLPIVIDSTGYFFYFTTEDRTLARW